MLIDLVSRFAGNRASQCPGAWNPLYAIPALALCATLAALPLYRAYVTPEGIPIGRQEVVLFEFLFFAAALLHPLLVFPQWTSLSTATRTLLTAWLTWAAVTVVVADPSLLSALFRLAEWWLHGLFALAVWAFVGAYPVWRGRIAAALVAGFWVYCAFFTYSHILTEEFDPLRASNITGSGFNNIRHFGYYGTAALVCALGLMMESAAGRRRALMGLGFASAVLAWTFLFWAGGRGPFFAVLLSAPVLMWLVRHEPWLWRFAGLAVLSLLLGMMGSLLLPEIHGGLARLFYKSLTPGTFDGVSSGRLAIWTACLGDIQAHPWFGVGPDNYRFNCGLVSWRTAHPHNIGLQAVLEWGIPGAILFFALLTGALRHSVKSAGANGRYAMLWCALALLAFSLVDGTLYHAFPTMIFVTAMAVCLAPVAPVGGNTPLRVRLRLAAVGSLAAYLILLF